VSLVNYDPRLHFLLDVARDDLWQPDGSPEEMPYRLNGISGCSIWQPGRVGSERLDPGVDR
jgi:hypothetical protein